MVFSSLYLDPHNNWHQAQQENQQQLINIIHENSQQLQPPRPPSPLPPTGSIRPGGTMADRARLAKMAQPETPLKCPRCDSSNTKFCYFNNYSLSQPRHFCKTCRRYWTRGGALRNVPVGGGCRRNKGNKRSKSPAATSNRKTSNSSCSTSSVLPSSSRGADNNMLDHVLAAQSSQLPFLPSMHLPGGYGSSDIGLSFGGIQTATAAAAASNNGGSNFGFLVGMDQPTLSSGISEQWRLQQFPFFSNLGTSVTVPSGLQGVAVEQEQPACYVGQTGHDHQLRASCKQMNNINGITQLSPVKMEGNQRLNLPENFSGISANYQYWGGGGGGGGGGGNAWSHLSDFSSSSTRHLL